MVSIYRTFNYVKRPQIEALKVRLITIILLSLFLILSIIPNIITITRSYALQQVAGNIIIEIKPGETNTFNWGLLSEKNQSSTVNITADGIGAEFLSFPENVTLTGSRQINYVPVNVNIPSNYTGDKELNPSIRATEAGEEVGPTIINIAMSKPLCVVIAQNNATTANQDFTDLKLKPYTQKVMVRDGGGGNQSIITIPIESTSNITEFSFNETQNQISFKASGDAGTNGTTILYVGQVLQEPYSLMLDGIASTDFDIITNTTTGERGIQITYRHTCIDNDIILTGAEVTTQTLT
ncbi:MAG TPA: hypothetical protein VE572_01805 [Nitrososphaeraceae archaeon]|jgi:hypothetical protein|nr:hypothetical protein [Nitrososphaeraceae archaeon]